MKQTVNVYWHEPIRGVYDVFVENTEGISIDGTSGLKSIQEIKEYIEILKKHYNVICSH